MSINQVFLIGRITADPELKTAQSGTNYVQFTLAVDRPKTQNNQDPGTDFIPVVVFNGQAKNLAQYVKKGRQLAVTGSLRVDILQLQDGTKKTTIRVFADRVEFLGSPQQTNGNQSQAVGKKNAPDLSQIQAQPARSNQPQQQATPQQAQPAQQQTQQNAFGIPGAVEVEIPEDFPFDVDLPF